jgi:hypothetical protein
MRMPSGLRRLDDRVLGRNGKQAEGKEPDDPGTADRAGEPGSGSSTQHVERTTTRTTSPPRSGDGASKALALVWRISRLVLLALGLVVLTAAALILLPSNEDNVIVRNVLSLAETVAGPFRDVFTVEDPDRMRVVNYGLAAVVYVVLSAGRRQAPHRGKRT